jgi:hypothetical protein
MRVNFITTALGCSLLLAGSNAWAALVAYDPFLSGDNRSAGEYTPGTDMRTMGAAALGWVGSGGVDGFGVAYSGTTSNFQANATGEDSVAVAYEAGGRMQWLGVGNFPADRNITRQLNPIPSSSEWWFSIMTNRLTWAGTPANNTHIVGGFTNAAGNGLQVGYGGDNADLILRSNGINTVLSASVPNDNQYVLVRLDVNTAGNDTISVWVDPASVTGLGAPDVTITNQDLFSSLAPFTQSRFESPGQAGVAYFDEIRLATTFESVTGVPEPGCCGIIVLGLTAVGHWRRRFAS